MKVIRYLLIICLLMASSLPLVGMDAHHAQTDVIEDCFICVARPGTVDLRTIFSCADVHPQRICEHCSTNYRTTRQEVEYYGPREWVCPLCRAPKIGIAQAPVPAPRPAAPHMPQPRPHAAQPAHHVHHHNPGNQHDVRIVVTNEGKVILLMAAIGTIYCAAKYIYNRFNAQEKPLNTDDVSDFGFDVADSIAISDSDIDSFASDNQSDILLDEDWFN